MCKSRKNITEQMLTFSRTKMLASLFCHSDMHVAYLQEQLGGQRPSEVGTHTKETPPVSLGAFSLSCWKFSIT